MASNTDDILRQLREAGFLNDNKSTIDNIKTVGRIVRCYVDEDRHEKRGWYILHEFNLRSGQRVYVGSYGIYHGDDSGAIKFTLSSDFQQTKEDLDAMRKQREESRKLQKAEENQREEAAALLAEKVWRQLKNEGECDYLANKKINPPGVRFTNLGNILISTDLPGDYTPDIITKIPKNSMAVPVLDATGKIYGIEFILDSVSNKERIERTGIKKQFFPPGMVKKSRFFMMGSPQSFGIILITEGLATADSIRQATGMAVAVAFDAGNINPVIDALKAHYPKARFLICADDDRFQTCKECKAKIEISHSDSCPECGQPHGKQNTGVTRAMMACTNSNIRWVMPQFKDDQARFDHYKSGKGKLSDFNDLHLTDGLHLVTQQIETALSEYGWESSAPARVVAKRGGGDASLVRPIDTTDELIERYWLVYGKNGMVFDAKERMLITLSDMRDICRFRDAFKRWHESAYRKIVKPDNVGFDPSGKDKNIICNLWGGWPAEPKQGNCDALLELFLHMCSGESQPIELAAWGLKWHAYPIQNPGAKMKTAMVIHGPQGSGKNLWTEAVMAIYGNYGRILDQYAVEDKHNDYLSRKLFLIADEVVARSDRYHVKNILKGLITGSKIRINPKNMASYEEDNHANIVFLSNERIPVVLEEDDRRHFVIWTPPPKPPEFYQKVNLEIKNGGIEALHYYLLNLPLGDFNEHTKPPMTTAKRELIDLGKESIIRFHDQWQKGEIHGVPYNIPAPNDGLYNLYKHWCFHEGIKAISKNVAMDRIAKVPGIRKERKEWISGTDFGKKFFYFPPGCKEKDINDSEKAFLGNCMSDFNDAVKDYKTNAL